jgi:tetratricopeptide (TPR) repeat protein
MTRKHNDRLLEIHVQTNLAEGYLRSGDWDATEEALSRGESLALELDAKHNLPEIYRVWAELALLTDRFPAALDHARRSIHLAESVGEPLEQGMGLRVLGQVLAASEQPDRALASFEQSLSLVEKDPYQMARTRMHYGLTLVSGGSRTRGETLLEQARAAFQGLGAEYDYTQLDALTGS